LAWGESQGLRDLHAIRQYLDWLVMGGVLEANPAAPARGPKYVIKMGKTLVLDTDQTRALLDANDTSTIVVLRDCMLIGVMLYCFARVSSVIGMRVEDYYLTAGAGGSPAREGRQVPRTTGTPQGRGIHG
jgi:site-specific recombinase XerC